MALEGAYSWKGIDIAKAYVKINSVNWSCTSNQVTSEKTPAKYNEDGTIKSEAVMETKWVQNTYGNWNANVYKDKASRDSKPNEWICSVGGSFEMDTKASAKNPVVQAYTAAKAEDTWKEYKDV